MYKRQDKKASVFVTSHEKLTEILFITGTVIHSTGTVHSTGKSTWKERSRAAENIMAEKFKDLVWHEHN